MSVPNQKTIGGTHKEPCDKQNIYAKINIKAIDTAMNILKPSTVKVWFYFAKNQEGYKFELSSKAVCAFCNITDKTYREAIKELVEQRYLIQKAKNIYDFYEMPQEVEYPKNNAIIVCHTTTILTNEA